MGRSIISGFFGYCGLIIAGVLFFQTAATSQLPEGTSKLLQSENFVLSGRIAGSYDRFYVDKLGNYYLLGKGFSQINKLDKNGDSISRYNNVRQFGAIASLDVSNPLKLVVYYKDFATVVILDRFLNSVNTIDLRRAGIMQAGVVATSYDNQLWVYDPQEAKIKKVDGQGKVQFASSDLRTVFDREINPGAIIDNDGLLYLYDPNYGWYIFDYYGGFKKQIPQPGLTDVGVVDGQLTGRQNNRLWVYDPKSLTGDEKTAQLPTQAGEILQMQIAGGQLYLLDTTSIAKYRIQP